MCPRRPGRSPERGRRGRRSAMPVPACWPGRRVPCPRPVSRSWTRRRSSGSIVRSSQPARTSRSTSARARRRGHAQVLGQRGQAAARMAAHVDEGAELGHGRARLTGRVRAHGSADAPHHARHGLQHAIGHEGHVRFVAPRPLGTGDGRAGGGNHSASDTVHIIHSITPQLIRGRVTADTIVSRRMPPTHPTRRR